MKKMTLFLALVLALSIPSGAYAAEDTICTFRLNASVHSEKRSMNTIKIVQNFFVKCSQFFIYANYAISLAFAALFFMRTVCTFFTLIEFFCSPIFVSLYGSAVNVMEFFVVRTHQITVSIYAEIHCSVWIIMVFNILAFFFIHGKFHVFSHSVFFTVQIVVEASVVVRYLFRSI